MIAFPIVLELSIRGQPLDRLLPPVLILTCVVCLHYFIVHTFIVSCNVIILHVLYVRLMNDDVM